MKPIDVLSALPKWAGATPREIISSPAWAMPCKLGETRCTMRLGAVRQARQPPKPNRCQDCKPAHFQLLFSLVLYTLKLMRNKKRPIRFPIRNHANSVAKSMLSRQPPNRARNWYCIIFSPPAHSS